MPTCRPATRHARHRALPFRLHGAVRAAYGRRRAWSRRCPSPRATSAWCRPSPWPARGAWWNALEFDAAPKIIARLPFVERADHPAALPVFVISRAAADAMVTEVEVWSMRVAGWSAAAAKALGALAEVDRGARPRFRRRGAARSRCRRAAASTGITDALVKAGASVRATALVGSHATRYRVSRRRRAAGRRPAADRVPESVKCPPASARSRVPACSTSSPMCRARARRRASRACSSCRRTRRRSARARRRSRPIAPSPSTCRIIPTAPRPRCARRSGAPSGSTPTASSAARARTSCSNLLADAYLARRRRGDPHHARLPGLSDRDARRRRQAGRGAGEELHRRRRRDPGAR